MLKVIIVCYINIVKIFYKVNRKMNTTKDSYFANNDNTNIVINTGMIASFYFK